MSSQNEIVNSRIHYYMCKYGWIIADLAKKINGSSYMIATIEMFATAFDVSVVDVIANFHS